MDRKWWTLIAVCVGTFMLLLDVTIVNVALPAIQSSIHANFSDLQWVIDAYSLVLAALLLTTGSVADLYGRRLVFVVGLVIFTGSSLGSGLSTTPLMLNLFRGAQGVGGAAMFSTSLALLGSAFQGRERGTAFGVWGAITGLAVAIGPVIGGALTTGLSWRWIFLVNVPIGVVAVFLTLMKVEESRLPGRHRVDPIGVVTFSGALGALVLALIKADQRGWGSTYILVLLAGAVAGILLFLIAELVQGDRAMFDLKLFRKPTFTGGNIAAFALSGGFFALFLYLTLYLQDILGFSALQTGLRFLVLSGGILLTSTLAGRLTAYVPIRFLIAPGLALAGAGLLLMRGVGAGTDWEHLIPGFIVGGAGVGLINPPLASTAIGVVPPQRAGMASGINSTFRQVGIATGIAGLGTLFTHQVTGRIVSLLSGTKGVTPAVAHRVAETVSQGSGAKGAFASLPATTRPVVIHAVDAGFTHGLNVVFLVGALLSFAAAVLTLVLIRSKDFEASAARGGGAPTPTAATGESAQSPEEPTTAVEEPATAAEEPAVADEAPTVVAGEDDTASNPFRTVMTPSVTPSASPPVSVDPEEPVPEPAAPTEPADELQHSAQTLIDAAEQAVQDYGRLIEREAARHREAELEEARAQADVLIARAMERSDDYADSLRRRLVELSEERDRLVARLRGQIDSAARYAGDAGDTRAELYRLIGELGRAPLQTADAHDGAEPDRADGGAGASADANGSVDGNANGTGQPEPESSELGRG